MSILATIAVLLCIDGAIGGIVTSFVQNEPTVFLSEPQSQRVELGSPASFSCNSTIVPTGYPLYPQLTITWLKDGTGLKSPRIVVEAAGGYSHLYIANVTEGDAGYYQCSINDGPCYQDNTPCPSLEPTTYTYITLSAPAYLTVITNTDRNTKTVPLSAAQNEPLLLQCNYDPAQAPDVAKWSLNGIPLTQNSSKGCILLMNQKLLIQHMSGASAGNYSCVAIWFAENRQLKTTYLVTLNNDTYKGTEVLTIDHPSIAKNGSSYELDCYTSPHTDISVVWLRNGTIISQGHSLKLETISIHSSGVYTCAVNQDTSQSTSVIINVLVPPVVTVGQFQTIYVRKYDTEHIMCTAESGNPTPTTVWYKNGKQLNNQTLVISYNNYGIFQCFANNTAGVSYGTIRVLRYGVPSPPVNLQCKSTVATYMNLGLAVLRWGIPSYSGHPTAVEGASVSYTVTVCANGQAESSETTSSTLYQYTMRRDTYTYFYYITSSVDGISSGATYCRVFPPDRFLYPPTEFHSINCSQNYASATWTFVNRPRLFITLDSVRIWSFCLNGSKMKAIIESRDVDYTQMYTTDLSIVDIGLEFICFFGGHYGVLSDGRADYKPNIPTQVCSQRTDIVGNQNVNDDGFINLTCTGNRAILSWATVCLAGFIEIDITGICSNYSMDQNFHERSSDSRGTVSYDIQTNITGCFFQFLIGDGSRTFSGTLLCSFLDGDQSTDHYTVCSQGQLHRALNITRNVTIISDEESSVQSSATPSVISIIVVGVVTAFTVIVALIILIAYRKILSIQIAAEKRILDQLQCTNTTIHEKVLLQKIAVVEDNVSDITVIESLTFPFHNTTPSIIVQSCAVSTASLSSNNQPTCCSTIYSSDVIDSNLLCPGQSNHSSITMVLNSYDQIEHTASPNETIGGTGRLQCGTTEELYSCGVTLPDESHGMTSGSSNTDNSCSFSGIE